MFALPWEPIKSKEMNMSMKNVEKLEDLNYGAPNEQFAKAWQEMIRNITDPATKATAKREIVITVTVVPTEDRNMAATRIDVKTKLAPVREDVGSIMFDIDDKGQVVARAYEAETQNELFVTEKEAANGR